MERDDEIAGVGNTYNTANRNYDARIARWFSLDPAKKKYPTKSPYNSFGNNPVIYKDPGGDDYEIYINHESKVIVMAAVFTIPKNLGDVEKGYIKSAAENIRDQSVKYVVDTGDEIIEYDVQFDVMIEEVSEEEQATKPKGITNRLNYLSRDNFELVPVVRDPDNDQEEELPITMAGIHTFNQTFVSEPSDVSGVGVDGIIAIIQHEMGHAFGLIHPWGNPRSNMNSNIAGITSDNTSGNTHWYLNDIAVSLGHIGIGKYKTIFNRTTWDDHWSNTKYPMEIRIGKPIIFYNYEGEDFDNYYRNAQTIEGQSTLDEVGTRPSNFENGEIDEY